MNDSGNAEQKPSGPPEAERRYLEVGQTGPRRWVLAIGALVVAGALVATFYGLYAINRGPPPTLSPDPQVLTQVAIAQIQASVEPTPSDSPIGTAPPPLPLATLSITATARPPTYTVQQGDTLIAIADRLNIAVDDLTTLNQLSGETIFPNQVLVVPPTVTPWPETGPFPHVVSQGETLLSIASRYRVAVDDIKTLNGLTSDTILVGQQILIPAKGVRPPTPTPTLEPWTPAVITGALDVAYSLAAETRRFSLHIPPDTRASAASEMGKVTSLVHSALDHSQRVLQRRFDDRFEVYVTDTLFAPPHTRRRSISLPEENRLFLFFDGSGTLTERLYFATYALTHLIASQKLGQAASPLLGEGLAVYAGEQALKSEGVQGRSYLLPSQFCNAYQQTGTLPRVSRELTFEGHLGHSDQYFAAGCFVGYLIEENGAPAFEQVYLGGDYRAVYGRTLNQLESDWIAFVRDGAEELPADPEELVRIAAEIDSAYRRLWAGFEGSPTQLTTYAQLDGARLSLLQGRLDAAREHLDKLETLSGDQ